MKYPVGHTYVTTQSHVVEQLKNPFQGELMPCLVIPYDNGREEGLIPRRAWLPRFRRRSRPLLSQTIYIE